VAWSTSEASARCFLDGIAMGERREPAMRLRECGGRGELRGLRGCTPPPPSSA